MRYQCCVCEKQHSGALGDRGTSKVPRTSFVFGEVPGTVSFANVGTSLRAKLKLLLRSRPEHMRQQKHCFELPKSAQCETLPHALPVVRYLLCKHLSNGQSLK